jgi:hypothetical protein
MSSESQSNEQGADELEATVDQAITACGGDLRVTIRALIIANNYLELEVSELNKAVSHAYVRGRFRTYTGQERSMAEVTYFVALPFVAADDGIAAGEPTECFNPMAVVMRAEALSRKPGHVGLWPSAEPAIRPPVISATQKSSRSSARCRTISVPCSRQINLAVEGKTTRALKTELIHEDA